jgi:predicted metal-dependent hydrolase
MVRKSIAELFDEGIDLFNAGRFFECHEAWEQAWLRSTGTEKLFYQGMIQAAVAILHVQRGNPDGARSLRAKAADKLNPLPAEHMGIALAEFRQSLDSFFGEVLSGHSPPDGLPRVRRLDR